MIRAFFVWMKHLIYAMLIVAALAGAGEVGLRVYDSATGQITRRALYDRGLVCKSWFTYQTLKPAHNFAVKNPDTSEKVSVSINSLGLRGPEITVPKRSGVFRIVCVGDEQTLAVHMPEEQTFCRLLQQQLQAQASVPVEVVNAGVPDYCPLLSCLQVRHQLLPLQADLVIDTFEMGDVADDYHIRKRTTMDATGAPQCCAHPDLDIPRSMSGKTPLEMLLLPKWGQQQIGRIWAEKMMAEQQRGIGSADGRYLWLEDQPPDWTVYVQQTLQPLSSLQTLLAEQQRGTLLVGILPAPWQVSASASNGPQVREKAGVPPEMLYSASHPFETVTKYCAEHKLLCCDPAPAFRTHPQADALYLKNAAVLSASGHAVYAQELARQIVQQVPGPWNGTRPPASGGDSVPFVEARNP